MKWKTILGVCMIIGSLLILVFWETMGRDYLLLSPILTANRDIAVGTTVKQEDFAEMRVPPGNVLVGAISPSEALSLIGLVAKVKILDNQQLLPSYFQSKETVMSEGESLFVIPELWICSRSSAIRAGDMVEFYILPSDEPIGNFRVAFVKDNNEREVRDLTGENLEIMNRTDSTSVISHIEIICTVDQYLFISDKVAKSGYGNLLIVVKGLG